MARPAQRLQVGAHTSIGGGLHRALERGADCGSDVVQIFSRSNQQWKAKPIADGDVDAWREARRRTRVRPAMVHGCYLINLCATTQALRERSYQALADELRRCDRLDIPYLVLHPGAHCGDGEVTGIERIGKAIDRLFDEHPDLSTRLVLENTAGQGSNLGYRFAHLRDLFGAVRRPERLAVCIDTCHTLAAGYDIRTRDGWEATFEELDRTVGCDKVVAFHVNDSKTPLGSRVDRHEHLGRGHLGLEALRCLVNDPRFVGLPMTIETPKPSDRADVVNVAILRALHGISRVGARARRLAAEPLE